MAEIAKLNIAELDFDSIKNNLKDYFASQAEFTDHDFWWFCNLCYVGYSCIQYLLQCILCEYACK